MVCCNLSDGEMRGSQVDPGRLCGQILANETLLQTTGWQGNT